MRYKRLGKSDLEVSVTGVGCMMFGSMCDQATTTAIVDAARAEMAEIFKALWAKSALTKDRGDGS